MYPVPQTGVFHPCPGNPVHPKARRAFVLNFLSFFHRSSPAPQLAARALCTLPVTSCSCTCTSSLMDGTIWQGFTHSCRIPTTHAAMTSPCASRKANLAVRGVHHANKYALLVGASQTHSRGKPVRSESVSQPNFCPSAGSAKIHRRRSRTGNARGGCS